MKCIDTQHAVGHVLCHDLTQIVKDTYKGPRFRKGHIVTQADIPVLLSMGKAHLYVWEMTEGCVHEDEAALRLAGLCGTKNMVRSEIKEGKLELSAACDGLFRVDSQRLKAVNSVDDVMLATRRGNTAVRKGDKLAAYGIETIAEVRPGDDTSAIVQAIAGMRERGADLILCTGGMSVDPDDNTPGAIRKSGARIVSYGAPVLPGAMFLLGYYDDGTPVMGLPGCVMFAGATVFDLVLPRVAAGVPVTKADLVELGEGGLCLGCKPCHWPSCPFGK
ncbi:Probable molybdopterin binding domain-containing protein [Oscillibacter sp. PC13]|uniref:molybdopterin-binding protein n=1 Tax=Oscillibacter sp. PC13 TaxID=1855299 RepID=UPI0008EBA0A3|nr:molybdopterin-binding protein [Oscillibacter sp. PC13]SFP95392.1 Probable molybdopterin binding domain-containing protein [Oscillibacter sp. PC13]